MIHELIQFSLKHWVLVVAFVSVLILIFSEEAKSQGGRGSQLTAAGLTSLINHEKAVLVDLRDESAFREGHIIGAMNLALADFDRSKVKIDPYKDRPIVLIDALGGKTGGYILRLRKVGFEKVYALKGGMQAWRSADMPVVKGQQKNKLKARKSNA